MIIDAHTHMFHAAYLEQLSQIGGEWAKKKVAEGLRVARQNPLIIDMKQRLEQLDRNGIDFQVVTPLHSQYSYFLPDDIAAQHTLSRAINDGMARLVEESKGRLIACGAVLPEGFEPGGRQEMERAINTLGLKAMCLSSNLNGKPLDTPELEPFWANAAEMGIPVYIHPSNPISHNDRSYEAEYDLIHNFGWPFETMLMLSRLVFSGVMERYPTLKVVSHHLGGGIPFFWGRITETYNPAVQEKLIGRVLPKPLFDYFSLFYYDTAVGGSAPAIKCAYEVFGANQLLFATDAPYGPGESRLASYPKVIRSLGLPEADNNKICAGNARRILNLA